MSIGSQASDAQATSNGKWLQKGKKVNSKPEEAASLLSFRWRQVGVQGQFPELSLGRPRGGGSSSFGFYYRTVIVTATS